MSEKKQNPNRRYVGKVRVQNGQYGEYSKIMIDNPFPNNEDGSENKYHKGTLVWLDHETGKKFAVKQFSVRGVAKSAQENGFVSSICIDIDSQYEVQELE